MIELPEGWVATNFNEVLDYVQRGKSPKYTDFSELPVINQKCVRWWGIEEEFLKYIREDQHDTYTEERFLQNGDVLWNSTGTGTIGRAALYSGLKSAPRAVVDGHVTILRTSAAVEPSFLFNFIRSSKVQDLIEDMQSGSTNQVELSKTEVLKTEILLPPLPEQRRIVKKLDTLSACTSTARDHLTAIAKLVERYKLAFLENMFFNNDVANHHSVSFLETAESTQNGLSKRKGDEGKPIKVLRLADLKDNEFRGDDPREIVLTGKELEKFALHDGDILIVRVNGSEKIVGRMLVWGEEQGWAFCDHFIRAKTLENFDPKFVRWLFETDRVRGQIESSFVSSAGQKTINKTILSEVKVPQLPIEEQRKIVRRIETAFAKIDRLADEAETALKLTGSLDQRILAKAFAGKLVPQDPNDEPGIQLLARIQEARANAPKKPRKKPTKAKPMKVAPQERVLTDCVEWPETGLPFEDVANRITLPHDQLKDAIFALLEGDTPKLRQEFDTDAQIMKLIRVAS